MPVLKRLFYGCGTLPVSHLAHFIDPFRRSLVPPEGVVEITRDEP